MPGEQNEVKSDYTRTETATSAGSRPTPEPPPRVEIEKYGSGKPRRVVIRARITRAD